MSLFVLSFACLFILGDHRLIETVQDLEEGARLVLPGGDLLPKSLSNSSCSVAGRPGRWRGRVGGGGGGAGLALEEGGSGKSSCFFYLFS